MQVAIKATIDVSKVVTEMRFSIVQAFCARFDIGGTPGKTGPDAAGRSKHRERAALKMRKKLRRPGAIVQIAMQ
jgi:hypothetical protein